MPPSSAPAPIVPVPGSLTIDQVARALPASLKRCATQSLVDELNKLQLDPEHAETVRENFLSYTKVLQEGRFKVEDYLHAVKFVSFKLMGYTNQDSYYRTFPQRHAALVARGATPQDISAYVSMYAKGKLVNLILEQSLVPSWVLNQDSYQKAINVQVEIMTDQQNSATARTLAANSLLTHLKKPEAAGPLVNIDLRENSGVNELKDLLGNLARQQIELIQKGVTTREIAAQPIIEKDRP